MHTLTPDALRRTIQDLDEAIRCARICMRKGDSRLGGYLADYKREIRRAYVQRRKAKRLGATGPLWELLQPIPINPGFVGLTAEEKFKRSWRLDTVPAPAQQRAA